MARVHIHFKCKRYSYVHIYPSVDDGGSLEFCPTFTYECALNLYELPVAIGSHGLHAGQERSVCPWAGLKCGLKPAHIKSVGISSST
jgi:hypothetical protein